MANNIDKILEAIDRLRAAQKQTDEQLKQTDKRIDRLGIAIGNLTGGWGRFVEDLMAPSIQARFQEAGFKVRRLAERLRAKVDGQVVAEHDVVLFGTSKRRRRTILLVSIKSRVKAPHVDELIKEVEKFFDHFKEYRTHDLMGAIAGVGFPEAVQRYAEKKGLYVIHTSDEMARVVNKPGFKPKRWSYRRRKRRQ